MPLNKKSFFFVTGARSEFGQFSYFLKKLSKEKKIDLSILVTGMHLSKKHGYTYKDVVKTNLKIIKKIDLDINNDKSSTVPNAISRGIKKFNNFFIKNRPDYLILPCDRFEILCPAIAAFFLKIPIIHFYGGETSEGSFDNTIRDQISLMSSYHFVSHDLHKKKLNKIGIKKNIFNIGVLAYDKIKSNKLYDKRYLEKKFKINFNYTTSIVTFHPTTKNQKIGKNELINLLKALKKISELQIIFTGTNNDPGNEFINSKIKEFCSQNPSKFKFYSHLGSRLYHSLVANVDFNIGNSSSLLYEVPFFDKYSFNIGSRQDGRLSGESVVNIKGDFNQIYRVINKYLNKKKLKKVKNPYYKKNSTSKTINYFHRYFLS